MPLVAARSECRSVLSHSSAVSPDGKFNSQYCRITGINMLKLNFDTLLSHLFRCNQLRSAFMNPPLRPAIFPPPAIFLGEPNLSGVFISARGRLVEQLYCRSRINLVGPM